jgi:hypothetical protein
MAGKTEIIAHLPSSVEISKRTAKNALKIDVKLAGSKQGTLHIAQGSVTWWPAYGKKKSYRRGWSKFIALLEAEMPRVRSTRN